MRKSFIPDEYVRLSNCPEKVFTVIEHSGFRVTLQPETDESNDFELPVEIIDASLLERL
jgi:hypothetical protein